mmetsp:Transcript_32946/g.98098  ORF Transcript_32946/g.98098 Transcript_32946/m.98098 type:complete len:224 (+) Transcript_32946:602-1273(+)
MPKSGSDAIVDNPAPMPPAATPAAAMPPISAPSIVESPVLRAPPSDAATRVSSSSFGEGIFIHAQAEKAQNNAAIAAQIAPFAIPHDATGAFDAFSVSSIAYEKKPPLQTLLVMIRNVRASDAMATNMRHPYWRNLCGVTGRHVEVHNAVIAKPPTISLTPVRALLNLNIMSNSGFFPFIVYEKHFPAVSQPQKPIPCSAFKRRSSAELIGNEEPIFRFTKEH